MISMTGSYKSMISMTCAKDAKGVVFIALMGVPVTTGRKSGGAVSRYFTTGATGTTVKVNRCAPRRTVRPWQRPRTNSDICAGL